jgi:4-amino-4-deoxy-L-arabinose transferase-like glycosyltransferase
MKREYVYRAAAFLLPFAVLSFACLNQPNRLGLYVDDGLYFQAAQSLVEGKGYRALFFPGEPYQTVYPPLYSLSLAFFMILGLITNGGGFQIALPNIVFLSLASLVFYDLFRHRFPDVRPGASVLVTWLAFCHPDLWHLVHLPMSEPLFILLYLLILRGFDKYEGAQDSSGFWLGMGVFLGLSLMTRMISVSLVVGAMLWLLLQHRIPWNLRLKHTLTLLFPAFVFYGIWNLYLQFALSHNPPTANSILFTYYKAYSFRENQLLSFLPSVVVFNVISSFEWTARLMAYGLSKSSSLLQHKSLVLLCGAMFLGLSVIGGYSGIRKRRVRPEHLMFLVYLGVVFVWPFSPGRFLVALIPWFALLFAEAFDRFQRHGRAGVVLLLLVFCIQGIGAGRFYVEVVSQPLSAPSSTQEALKWMSDHLPREAVVASASPLEVYFRAHRKSVPALDGSKLAPLLYPHTVRWTWSGGPWRENVEFVRRNQENIWNAWREIGVTHIFFDGNEGSGIDSLANAFLINSHLSQLVRIYATPTTGVFEVHY